MKVLAIGNSYSQDATRYLHQVAKSDDTDMKVVNLYIGGCPLSKHYRNMMGDYKAYGLEVNGISTGFLVSIKEALLNDEWDVVTVQQQSSQSADYETFQPYLNALCDYIKKYCPKAKIMLHQTWSYKEGSPTLERTGHENQLEMYKKVENSYNLASKEIGAEIIPSGKALQNLLKNGIEVIHRDDIHASFGLGRLTLALTWYEALTGNSVDEISLPEYDEPIDEKELIIAKMSAHDAVLAYKNQ